MQDPAQEKQLVKLCEANLDRLPHGITGPGYDRSKLRPGIVHIGLGNFHRAHQAWYLHRLMQTGAALDWAIIGAGVRPYDAAMRDRLLEQNCLTTLIELSPATVSAEVTGPMIGYLPIENDNGSLIRQMSDPAIRIVSLTVTEGGYFRDANGRFDPEHPDIIHDARNPRHPRTAFGAMVAALAARREAGHLPFTALSCDNLQGNGRILRQCVVGLARLSDADLALWIDKSCTFPNSMVDCIVPATTPEVIETARSLGIDDAAPVTHENFRQWVIEDDFCAGRPDWDQVGATFSDQVHDYETMKIRVLNAGHQVVANLGEILSIDTIADCMTHPTISAFLRKVETDGILPHVQPVPGMAPVNYLMLVEGRFANPAIVDTTRRVAFDGSSRHPGFILPILREALAAGKSIDGFALVEALWARMCEGTRDDGTEIEPNDPYWSELQVAAIAARERPASWLEQEMFYGDIGQDAHFSERFAYWLERIWREGAEPVTRSYLTS